MKQNFGDSYDMDSSYSNRHYYRVILNLIEQAVERNGYKDFCVIIRENLSIPQIGAEYKKPNFASVLKFTIPSVFPDLPDNVHQ